MLIMIVEDMKTPKEELVQMFRYRLTAKNTQNTEPLKVPTEEISW